MLGLHAVCCLQGGVMERLASQSGYKSGVSQAVESDTEVLEALERCVVTSLQE